MGNHCKELESHKHGEVTKLLENHRILKCGCSPSEGTRWQLPCLKIFFSVTDLLEAYNDLVSICSDTFDGSPWPNKVQTSLCGREGPS